MAMDLWRTRPYSIGHVIDRFFEPYFSGARGDGVSTGFQSLPVNIWQVGDVYHAALLAPGLDEQSINVTVQEDTLTIEGQLHFQMPEGARAIWQEFSPTRFRRTLRLGSAIDPAHVEASYQNGLVLVAMPRAEHARPRQIQVQMAGVTQPQLTTPEPAKKGKK